DVGLRSSNCHPAPEVGIGRALLTNRNPPNRHLSIMIYAADRGKIIVASRIILILEATIIFI
ncbi:hypothetical protein L103_02129, partial [Lactiplantibacillus plantarum IPLA88]